MVAMFVGLTSCNMDTPPVGVINPEDALLNYTDAVALRTGLYISFRGNVAGDVVYGNPKKNYGLNGQCLHAALIGFVHPITGEYLEFESDLPEYFKNFLGRIS